MPEGTYDPPVTIVLSDDLQRVENLPGSMPVIDGVYIPPESLPIPPSSGPTAPPSASPAFTVEVMFKTLVVKTDPIDVFTTLTYEVALDTAFTQMVLSVNTRQTYVQLAPLPAGVPLWVRVTAFNDLGTAPPASVAGPYQTVLIDGGVDVKDLSTTMQKFKNSLHLIY